MNRTVTPETVRPWSSLLMRPMSDAPATNRARGTKKAHTPKRSLATLAAEAPIGPESSKNDRIRSNEPTIRTMPHTSVRCSPSISPVFRGTAPSAEVVLFRNDFFFGCLRAVLRPLTPPCVVRVAMGYELYPTNREAPTTLRAWVRAKSYTRVIYRAGELRLQSRREARPVFDLNAS